MQLGRVHVDASILTFCQCRLWQARAWTAALVPMAGIRSYLMITKTNRRRRLIVCVLMV